MDKIRIQKYPFFTKVLFLLFFLQGFFIMIGGAVNPFISKIYILLQTTMVIIMFLVFLDFNNKFYTPYNILIIFYFFLITHTMSTILFYGRFHFVASLDVLKEGYLIYFLRIFLFSVVAFLLPQIISKYFMECLFFFSLGAVFNLFTIFFTADFEISRLKGFSGDPNYFAATCQIVFFILFFFVFSLKNFILRIAYGIASFIILFMQFLTLSRGGFLSFFSASFFLVLSSQKNLLKKTIILGFLLLLGIGIFYLPIFSDFSLRLLKTIDDGGSGRLEIWNNYLTRPDFTVFLFGKGLSFAREAIRNTHSLRFLYVPHNIYIDFLVEFGIIGLILFIAVLIFLYKKLLVISRISKIYSFLSRCIIAMLISFNVSYLFLSDITNRMLFFLLGFSSAFLVFFENAKINSIKKTKKITNKNINL